MLFVLPLLVAPLLDAAAPPPPETGGQSNHVALSAASVSTAPGWPEARAALAQGDLVAAAAAVADPVLRNAAPGLVVRVLEAQHDPAACALAQSLLTSNVGDVAAVHVVACAPSRELLLRVAKGPFRHDPRALTAAAAFLAKNELTAADVDLLAAPALDAPLALDAPEQRLAAARVLRVVARAATPATQTKARLRLLDELPEQTTDDDRALDAEVDVAARRVARAAVLEKLQKNEEVSALLKDLVGKDCEASLLVGKALRKQRHYAAARTALAAAAQTSCGDVKKKAQYLEARVARVQNAASADKLLSTFAKTYGADALVDDVLLWQAELKDDKGDVDGALAVLTTIITAHKDGDMADEARFRFAFARAKQKKTNEALASLDEAIAALRATARTTGKPRLDLLDRARYWRLRLALFPDTASLDPVDDAGPGHDARIALAAFADERGASFYGIVAGQLVQSLGMTSAAAGERRPTMASTLPLPSSLASDARFVLARAAADKGFDDDAAVLLDQVVSSAGAASSASSAEDVAFAAAAVFASLNRPDLAHRTLRNAGFALLPGTPRGDVLARWSLSWPRAFAKEIEAAAAEQKIPPALLMGLAREESTFMADVVSWAGAVGLCQLMPATAADEAQALKLPPTTTATLLDPATNARLGAAHLARRLRGMSHPLLAIGAYNAGPGAVAKWLPPRGTTMPLDLFVEEIPVDETRNYIKKVTGSWKTYTVLDGDGAVSFAVKVKG